MVGRPGGTGAFPHAGWHGDLGDTGMQHLGVAVLIPAPDLMALVATHHLLRVMRCDRVLPPVQEQNQVLMQASFVCVHLLEWLCILSIEN